MSVAAIPALAGAAVDVGSGINSGIKGAQASSQLNQRMDQQDQTNQNLMNRGLGLMGQVSNYANQFNNPSLSGQILNMGQNAAKNLGGINQQTAGYFQNPNALYGQAQQGMQGVLGGSNYNIAQQGMDAANQYATGAYNQALAASARGNQQFNDQLNRSLADRGISPNSGVAAAAASQYGLQSQQQLSQQAQQIQNQAAQTALQSGEFGVNSALQRGQLQLGASQGLAGLGQAQDQRAQLQNQYASAAQAAPLGILQNIYSSNYLQPGAQAMGNISSMLSGYSSPIRMAQEGNMQNLQTAQQGVQSAGAGKGAGIGGGAGMLGYASQLKGGGGGGGGGGIPASNSYTPNPYA